MTEDAMLKDTPRDAMPKSISLRQCFSDAQTMMNGKWGKTIGTLLILFFCSTAINTAVNLLFPRAAGVSTLCNAILSLACARFFFVAMRGEWPTLAAVEFAFDRFGTALAATLLVGLYVLAGLLLLIVPGIIFALNCAMVFFVLSEDRRMTAREAIRRSKEMMRGNRWKFFCLMFLLWFFLMLVSFALILPGFIIMAAGAVTLGGVVAAIFGAILVIVFILFYLVYFYALTAAFYRQVRPEALAEVEPPETPYPGMPRSKTVLLVLAVLIFGYASFLSQQFMTRNGDEQSLRHSANLIIFQNKYGSQPASTPLQLEDTFPAHLYVEGDWKKLEFPARTPVLIELPFRRGTDDFLVVSADNRLHRYKFERGISAQANYFDVIYANFDCSDKMKFELEEMAKPVFQSTPKPKWRW